MKQSRRLAWLLLLPPLAAAYFHQQDQTRLRDGYPLKLDTTTCDFGRLSWSDAPSQVVRFANSSRRAVVIRQVEGSCTCARASLSSRRIQSGERGAITVRFLPAGFTGKTESTVILWLDGFTQPVPISIRANVTSPLKLCPDQVEFGHLKSGELTSRRVLLESTSGQPVRITRLDPSADYVRAHLLPPGSANGRRTAVAISLVHPPAGQLREHVYLQTSLSALPRIEIPVRAQVSCKWELSDPEFFFGFIKKGEQASRTIVVTGLILSDIRRAWTDFDRGSVEIRPHVSPVGIEVTARIELTKAPMGQLRGGVWIETKDREQPLLRIPFVGAVQDPSMIPTCCSRRQTSRR